MTCRTKKRFAAAPLALVLAVASPHQSRSFVTPSSSSRTSSTAIHVIGEQASSIGPAQVLRDLKEKLPQVPWLADGSGSPSNKIDIPDHVARVLAQAEAPQREAESAERTDRIRGRAKQASEDALKLRGMLTEDDDDAAWWRTPRAVPEGGRAITGDDPLTVLVAGGGLAGLVVAAACHAKGMRVALFEQASSYAPYGGKLFEGTEVAPSEHPSM